jgi:hypothetical protein
MKTESVDPGSARQRESRELRTSVICLNPVDLAGKHNSTTQVHRAADSGLRHKTARTFSPFAATVMSRKRRILGL